MSEHNYNTNQTDILVSYQELTEKVKALRANEALEGDVLKFAIDQFIESHWQIYQNLELIAKDFDFTQMTKLHKTLIKDVIQVLNGEISLANQIVLDREINIKHAFNHEIHQVENEKLAYGIYLFTRQDEAIEYILIGDIHSDDLSLCKLLDDVNFYSKVAKNVAVKLIFMGDYVDRGKAHLKTVERIMLLKILFPKHVFLLRGNHDGGKFNDDGTIKLPYRIPDQDEVTDYFPKYLEYLVVNKRGVDHQLIVDYFKLFDALPYLAFIQTEKGVIQCVHGGLPKPFFGQENSMDLMPYDYIESLSKLTQYPELDNVNATILENLMWSDPYTGEGDYKMSFKRFKFDAMHYEHYVKRIGIWKLFRGHEARVEGYEINHGGMVYTIFSSGDTNDSSYNMIDACYAIVTTDGEINLRHFI